MISPEQAFKLIEGSVKETTRKIRLPVAETPGHVISADVISPVDLPPFRQSAMDGYAINSHSGNKYSLIGEIPAGDGKVDTILAEGEAVRIFTGSRVPDTATSVIMQEHVERSDETIKLSKPVVNASNIRPAGEQVRAGEVCIPEGTIINPGVMALAHSMGITELDVYELPRIAIIITGSELVDPGNELEPGQIYESNSVMLESAIGQSGIHAKSFRVADDPGSTIELIRSLKDDFDMLIFSGGISVGDHDYVRPALGSLEYEEVFYKVNQKPGKPLYFGKKADQYVFALPGNPASALTCFYIYVIPAIRRMSGLKECFTEPVKARITSDFSNRSGKTLFLKAKRDGSSVEILGGQPSSMVRSFISGNALIMIPADTTEVKEGDNVEVYDIFK